MLIINFCAIWLAQINPNPNPNPNLWQGARCVQLACSGPLPQLPLEFDEAADRLLGNPEPT